MTLIIEFKDGSKVQVTKIDSYSILGPLLLGITVSQLNPEHKTQPCGFNIDTIKSFYVDGEATIFPLHNKSGG